MTDEEDLRRALDASERDVERLEVAAEQRERDRRAVSMDSLASARLHQQALAAERERLDEEIARLETERDRERAELKRLQKAPTHPFSTAGALFWRSMLVAISVGSLLALYPSLRRVDWLFGVVLVALPVVAIALIVAGSIRESRVASAAGSLPSTKSGADGGARPEPIDPLAAGRGDARGAPESEQRVRQQDSDRS